MAMPASNGKLCTKLTDMSIGDYIRCEYIAPTAGVAGAFQNLGGESSLTELTTTPSTIANGYFYFIKADKGLLISDRKVQGTITGNAINNAGYLTGKFITQLNGLVRVLTRREFYNYLSNSTLNGTIVAQDENVWHSNSIIAVEVVQDRSGSNVYLRGPASNGDLNITQLGTVGGWNGPYGVASWAGMSATTADGYGTSKTSFRPVMEYIDNPKSTNIWY